MKTNELINSIQEIDTLKRFGKVYRVIGLMIESKGPEAGIGDVCLIHTSSDKGTPITSEVVGFDDEKVLLMPYSPIKDIAPGCLVEATGKPLTVKIGRGLIGKVIDSLGQPLDGSPLPKGLRPFLTDQAPPNPMLRQPIRDPIQVGVRAIDSLLTVGKGQRIGLFAGSGVGKSTLLGMIARNSNADINVIALIGERGREVREFIENDLKEEGLKRSIVVVATSDQPALMRIKGAYTATAISEFFREQGLTVNLMMDSVTRVAMAQREIGLATGEPPTTKGYTPSVFSVLPKLLERTGAGHTGAITAFYTVLVDGDDFNEPIADTTRGILDGHFILDRKLAEQGQFPALNILKSVSRVMPQIAESQHLTEAGRVRNLLASYEENQDLINIGAYKKGTNKAIDEAIQIRPKIVNFLKQAVNETVTYEEAVIQLSQLLNRGEE